MYENFIFFVYELYCFLWYSFDLLFLFSCQLLSWLFATPWTAACQASLSITNSWSSLKLMSIEWVMPSNHLILCHPLLLLPSVFPSISSFPVHWLFTSGGQCLRDSTSTLILPVNIQDWFCLKWTGLISFLSKGLSKVFSCTAVQNQ